MELPELGPDGTVNGEDLTTVEGVEVGAVPIGGFMTGVVIDWDNPAVAIVALVGFPLEAAPLPDDADIPFLNDGNILDGNQYRENCGNKIKRLTGFAAESISGRFAFFLVGRFEDPAAQAAKCATTKGNAFQLIRFLAFSSHF